MKRISPYNIIAALFLLVCFSSATPALGMPVLPPDINPTEDTIKKALKEVAKQAQSCLKEGECLEQKCDTISFEIVNDLPDGVYQNATIIVKDSKVYFVHRELRINDAAKGKPVDYYVIYEIIMEGECPDSNKMKLQPTGGTIENPAGNKSASKKVSPPKVAPAGLTKKHPALRPQPNPADVE